MNSFSLPSARSLNRPLKIHNKGFSLLEAVVGMCVLAIMLTGLSTLFWPLSERSADAFLRAKASQLTQAVMAELAGRQFDINTPIGGGMVNSIQCCSDNSSVCRGSGSDPKDWSLLDNFDGYQGSADVLLGDGYYDNFQVAIGVSCAHDLGWLGGAKLLAVTITTPTGEQMNFTQLRGNY